MRQVPEYDLENPSTWTVIEKPISESEERAIRDEFVFIAGLNPFGKSMLRMVWGVTHLNENLFDDKPKYYLSSNDPVLIGRGYRDDQGVFQAVEKVEDVPADKLYIPMYSETHLGERRFIVERWRSAEFLQASGRFQQTRDNGATLTYFKCRNCGSHVPCPPELVNADIERVCACGSRRVSPVDIREDGEGKLMRDLPREGCYDYFLRLQRKDGTYHPPNARALAGIRELWVKHQRSFKEKDAEIKQTRKTSEKLAKQARREIWQAI